ncbi:MAG: type II secretion system F family protein [Nitrospiraceae bacterium]|nr:MAG: type II secretion system F family protein [Nitrospiraceae bacterium]
MPFFTYTAINNTGETIKGIVEDLDETRAYDNISSSGLHIVKIRKSHNIADFYMKRLRSWGIKMSAVIEFASNLAVMLRSGLPLVTSISDIALTADNKRFRTRLLEVKRTIELGSSFSSSLAAHRDIFPEIFINLVTVGEETGRLDESLTEVAVHLQRMEDLRSAMIRALMYPVFALIGTTGALLFWLIYVLPKMSSLFESMDVELPALTKSLIAASGFSQKHWYVFFIVPVVFYILITFLTKRPSTKYYVDAAKLKIPVLKLLLTNKLLALFSEQLRILVTAGVTIDRSLDIMITVVNNSVFKKALTDIKENILLGSRISEAVKKHSAIFPNLVVRMISIGESTGNLNEQLNYLSEYYLKKLDDISQKMGKLIEPIIIIIIGSIFLIIILGLMAPIYDLISEVGKK